MKIIDNKKDYYDYVSGIYGIDPEVVYDRRNSVRLVNIGEKNSAPEYLWYGNSFAQTCFSTHRDAYDSYYYNVAKRNCAPWDYYYRNIKEKDYFWKLHYIVGIQAGWFMYVFELNKILPKKDSEKYIIEPKFLIKNRIEERYSDAPLIFGECSMTNRIGWRNISYDPKDVKKFICPSNSIEGERSIIENPILTNTWIPKFINPEEIWNDIYDYLISQKEKPIIDNRSDILHLEAAGFDKKTSFRNM